jgi:hypothetical protein
MDKQQRGNRLADQEDAQNKISDITAKLAKIGRMLKTLADAMLSQPENIIFTDGPEDLTKAPFLRSPVSCNWKQFPKIEDIAKLIQDLRHEQYRLSDIERSLKDPNRI